MDNLQITLFGVGGPVLVAGLVQIGKWLFGWEGRQTVVAAFVASALVTLLAATLEFFPESERIIWYALAWVGLSLVTMGAVSAGKTLAGRDKKE